MELWCISRYREYKKKVLIQKPIFDVFQNIENIKKGFNTKTNG